MITPQENLDKNIKMMIKLSSEIKSIHIYCKEMEEYTADLEIKFKLMKDNLEALYDNY